jgi:hypothetical protein
MHIILNDPDGVGAFTWSPAPKFDLSIKDLERRLVKAGFKIKSDWQSEFIGFQQEQITRLLNALTVMSLSGPGMPFVKDAIVLGLLETEGRILNPATPLHFESDEKLQDLFLRLKKSKMKWGSTD